MAKSDQKYAMPGIIRQAIEAGTHNYGPDDRQQLVVLNIVGYLAAISSLNYAFTYAAYDFNSLAPLVYSNFLSAALTILCPFLHRFGRFAAILFLTTIIFSSIFYFVSFLGRDSGIQLNYIGAAAVVLVVCGQRHLRFAAGIVFISIILHLTVWFKYPFPQKGLILEEWFLANLYTFSVISISAIIFVVVFYAFHLVHKAQIRADNLLHNIMPDEIAERLKAAPDETIADQYESASVIFADLTGFTPITASLGPDKTVAMLDDLFSAFDAMAEKYNVEKIKTIGDAYMAVAGVPTPDSNHTQNIALMAKGFLQVAKTVSHAHNVNFNLRIGIASGPVMAGIIGKSKFSYDVWGETVNLAARLEPQGKPGDILVNDNLYESLKGTFDFKPAVRLDLKGLGKITAWEMDVDT